MMQLSKLFSLPKLVGWFIKDAEGKYNRYTEGTLPFKPYLWEQTVKS